MAVTQRIGVRQSHSLAMTPQLKQAIRLLELSNIELAAFVEQQLEQNPLLERIDDLPGGRAARATREPSGRPSTPGGGRGVPPPGRDATPARAQPAGSVPTIAAGSDPAENVAAPEADLRQHLLAQLALDISDPTDRLIGLQLIDMMDETGYLVGDPAEVAAALGCPAARVAATLRRLQQFDPPGVFARNLAECLALQLADRDRLDVAMQRLLDHLALLATGDRSQLMRLCAVDARRLAAMIAEIRTLDPKPGLAFDRTAATVAVPDVIVRPQPDGGWAIELNADTLPRVLFNSDYVARLKEGVVGISERAYLREQRNAASWLVRALRQRAETLLKVAVEIVRRQDGFLRHGVLHLQPLVRREIAAAVGMHESTVSRVAANKYVATPRGLFAFHSFFSAALPDSRGSGRHAAAAVRARLRTLIDGEPGDATWSDEGLADLLRRDGIAIARRTVAKYRESMRIPSSFRRRRDKSL